MARIRSIKPEFPHSETIGRLSRDARLLFVQLWTIVDDSGRARASSRMLASLLYPYDDDVPSLIDGWLDELAEAGCVRRYEVDGSHFLDIPNWLKHQKIDKPSASKLPSFDEGSPTPREHSRSLATDLGPRKGPRTKDQDQGSSSLRSDETRARDEIAAEFDEAFWPAYPHKVGKPAAKKAFAAVRKATGLSAVMAGLQRYVHTKPPDRAWLNPATFLNQERFNDEPASPVAGPIDRTSRRPHDAIFRGLAKAVEERGLGTVNGRPAMMAGCSIAPDQHRQIQHEKAKLQATLTRSDAAEIAVEIAKLLAAFPTQDQSDVPAELRAEAYLDALGAVPAWAVREARLKIIRGATDLNRRFAPTPPQLAWVVEGIVKPLRSDLADLVALADARPLGEVTDDERARVSAGFDRLRQELGVEPPATKQAKARSNLERIATDLGIPRSAINALPDAPPRSGTFDKLRA